ncbi:Ca-activated chloride channel family protein [Pseudarcicella hirudinis]|uniref:Ca-activated chloride channel family protein n=1 Tax=Pseudarcicella hirudinis TaxID=1079859 RepID=A0A1I5Y8K3_9BACT|nr:VWA domain-containing protein [Pseudarcicella hirudinis]SFQ40572.1 Ca-activated chloride channel family protein [Pseudarcicella hirudinis]
MNWNQNLGKSEYWFIALFVLLYVLYLGRVFWIARRLKTTARSSILKLILRGIYFTLLIMALLDPSFGDVKGTIKAEGKDIFLLVDVSRSMDATDIQPSRLEKAKFEINRLIQYFHGDRIGLIVFSEGAFMLSPLTFDKDAINLFIPQINTKMLPEGGTDFTASLELTLEKMTRRLKEGNKSKVLVLISDGENFGGNNSPVMAEFRKKGINVFTVGIGTTNGSAIRNGSTYLKDSEGNTVITRLESESLKKIASDGRGEYFEINSTQDNFTELIARIEQISNNLIDQKEVLVTANKYFYFLIFALFLMCIDVFFAVRTFQL